MEPRVSSRVQTPLAQGLDVVSQRPENPRAVGRAEGRLLGQVLSLTKVAMGAPAELAPEDKPATQLAGVFELEYLP